MKNWIFSALILTFCFTIKAQEFSNDTINHAKNSVIDTNDFQNDWQFSDYLMEQNEIDLAILNLILASRKGYSDTERDSLNFKIGKLFLRKKEYSKSSEYFKKIEAKNTDLYQNAQLFSSFNQIFIGQYEVSKQTNDSIKHLLYIKHPLFSINQYGLALLERKMEEAEKIRKENQLDTTSKDVLINLVQIHDEIMCEKQKSPLIAGLLSTVVPGLGKYYAGRKGEAYSAFLLNLVMGGVLYENIRKNGISHPQTILYGSIFSVFYVGNIWGSAVSVNIKRNENKKIINDEILFNLHIAIKSL
jgi:hypothetical protein